MNGEDWFAQQSADYQRSVLGRAGLEAYRQGTPLSAWVGRRDSEAWGPMHYARSLREIKALPETSVTRGVVAAQRVPSSGTLPASATLISSPGNPGSGGPPPVPLPEPRSPIGPATPSAAAQIAAAEEQIYNVKTHEIAVLFDRDGNELWRKTGGATYVQFTQQEVAQFVDAILTHNHPSGGAFSDADLITAVSRNLAEIRATGTDDIQERWLYRMTRPEAGWSVTRQALQQAYQQIETQVQQEFLIEIAAGRMTVPDADRRYSREVIRRLAVQLGMDYSAVMIL